MVLTLQHLGLTLWPDLPAVTPATRGYAVHCGSDALARGAHTLAGSASRDPCNTSYAVHYVYDALARRAYTLAGFASRDPCNTRLCCTLWF